MFIYESNTDKILKFNFNDNEIEFIGGFRKILRELANFCFENGAKFDNTLTEQEVIDKISKTTFTRSSFHKLPNGEYLGGFDHATSKSALRLAKKWTENINIKDLTIEEGISSRIKKFGEIDTDVEDFDLDEDDLTPVEEPVTKIKVYRQNPFKQAICVLGESGAGKSVTIEKILENKGHNFEFIIPTAATTGLLAQFSPSKSGYVPSRLGKMLMEASKNPQQLYTAVFDEMHKSNVIEMINDELLQAISTKRNRGRRFISLDQDTAEIYEDSELEDDKRGNLLIPDNFGFIFISSKPRVIANNADFFNRVDIVLLKSYQEEKIETSEQLLSNKLDDEEKMKLASTRND